ncbi:hypothetical protein M408DRAFT_328953 [Serendipita vermifera MAFF 305830]|uniref:Rhodanese domain-containing protein n=1 Tax=Serendipita vermifera MAFF 305830 TaxID=933852 RepID=A0A0C3AXP8_SERVB|nr:hypothetical protein M408DRAFT_328953 [Serendipita vermifera MAFF 305830]
MAQPTNPTESATAWHDAYPTPKLDIPRISAAELADLVRTKTVGVDYIVVDVRRTDFEDTFVKGAINLPAHSFYPTVSTIAAVLSRIPLVIFHCNSCSPTGRGPRAAGWYTEELERQGIPAAQSSARVLDGGIKEYSRLYRDDNELISKL